MITHILKDGTIKQDITGHTVSRDDCPEVYEVIEREEKENGYKV